MAAHLSRRFAGGVSFDSCIARSEYLRRGRASPRRYVGSCGRDDRRKPLTAQGTNHNFAGLTQHQPSLTLAVTTNVCRLIVAEVTATNVPRPVRLRVRSPTGPVAVRGL